MDPDLDALARKILDANLYMVLGTADADGLPWASPVWYAAEGYAEFFWVSLQDARHSRNIAVRPEIGIVVFDSRVPAGTGQGVYMRAVAEQLDGEELERGIEVFSRVGAERGDEPWGTADNVRGSAPHRLYRATVSEHSMLDPRGHPVHGRGDYRTVVNP
jgi:nitroimidazol reductase NimA-like FMN-containing flavoprotein (pyridoxamine 5'-phosphate oxidase superfamily)